MAGTFEAFGNQVRGTMAGFANSVSGEIISSISPIITPASTTHFFARAYQITTGGRAEGAMTRLDHTMRKDCIGRFLRTECRKFRDVMLSRRSMASKTCRRMQYPKARPQVTEITLGELLTRHGKPL